MAGCPATLSLAANVYTQTGEHNHANDHQEILDLEAINWCKSEAMIRAVPLHTIFVEATMR